MLAWAEDSVGRRQWTRALQGPRDRRAPARHPGQRRTGFRLGQRQPHRALRREGPGHAARQPRAPARAGHAGGGRSGGLRGEGPVVLPRPGQEPQQPLPVDPARQHARPASNGWPMPTIRHCRFRVLVPRERGHEYDATDLGERFIIRSNWQAPNFRIVEAPAARVADRSLWRDVIAHRDDAFIDEYQVFNEWLAVGERSQGLRQLRVRRWGDGSERVIAADEPTYTATPGRQPRAGVRRAALHLLPRSPRRPRSTTTTSPAASARCASSDPVLGSFEPADYVAERLWITVRDGTKVPVSLVHRKGLKRNGRAPLLLYGYGAYGYSSDPRFSSALLSLLDRGFVYGHRPRARRAGDGTCLVRGRSPARASRTPSTTSSTSPAHWSIWTTRRADKVFADGRQRRRPADGRGGQPVPAAATAGCWCWCPSSTWSPPCSTPASR